MFTGLLYWITSFPLTLISLKKGTYICFFYFIVILSHTRPGSLKTCVYEGVRNPSLSNASRVDINELVSADIVLTTYDVLKEDLSHDSDRHEGDRRFLRFQKRFLLNF